MWDEFKKFIMRGNVVDMATGVIIGAAFGKIVSSFTSDIIMPPLGLLLGKVLHQPFGRRVCVVRRGEGGGRPRHCLRRVSQHLP